MSGTEIRRPLWRSYTQRFLDHAVAHVRAGGHAVVWRKGTGRKLVAWLLVPCGPDGEVPELSFWSLLSLGKRTFDVVKSGRAKGLAQARVTRDVEYAVEEWCERDAMWRGATRVVSLDCLACGACCRRNRVIVYDDDAERFRKAGRVDLLTKAYTKTSKGDVVLRLQASGDCVHLQHDNKCGIYALRPDNCSMFPAGSEPCLTSREDELDIFDGARLA